MLNQTSNQDQICFLKKRGVEVVFTWKFEKLGKAFLLVVWPQTYYMQAKYSCF